MSALTATVSLKSIPSGSNCIIYLDIESTINVHLNERIYKTFGILRRNKI